MEDWLSSAARARPGHPAVVTAAGSVTYAELDDRAGRVAHALAARGIGAGDRVLVSHPPGIEFAALLHAAARLGAAIEPVAPAEPPEPGLAGPAPAEPAPGDRAAGPAPGDRAAGQPLELDPAAVLTVVRTSGTTGTPKPVELTVANHAASAAASAGGLGVDPADRWLCPLPLHHVGGLGVLVRCAVNRTTAVIHERFDTERVKQALEEGDVTLASLVPTMLVRLREAGLTKAPNLRTIALGGGPIPPGLLDWAADTGIPVTPVYGMTESCSQVVAGSPGRPLPGVQLEMAPSGEILVKGAMVAPKELSPDGWLHTGDLGRLDGDGLLHVEGRLKELIVTGGENVAPLAVERALMTHPKVADAGVTGRPDPEWGEAVVAVVVAREPTGEEELKAWCRHRLAPHEVPKRIEFAGALPRTPGGKLQRGRL